MLARWHDSRHGYGACNDNGRVPGTREGARPGRGILAMASQCAGPIVLTYVAANVLIISKQLVN
ncbi:hypothetical protein [Microvirga massiliensis]|uniref:hypothetical protein n=1 Tax=Microvirga massiliensis TaxID=1033741 RepID=UPI00062B9706|nr:hypothetical protein [Microvirga massiliensis]